MLGIQVSQLRDAILQKAKKMMLEAAEDDLPGIPQATAQPHRATDGADSNDRKRKDTKDELFEVSRLAKKIRSREQEAVKKSMPPTEIIDAEAVAPGCRYAVRKRKHLPAAEILDIVHKVMVEYQTQKDVAKEHRLKPILVTALVKKARKNPKYLKAMLALRDEKETKRELIAGAIDEMNRRNVVIDSVAAI